MATNPYQAIVMARDSLKQRDETAKMQAEIRKLDNEASELEQRTEDEKVSIQELELVLVKKRRRAEKCRRLAESQSSSVVYKEQVRLNQAAASALLARLEAQKAICDSAERELHRKYKHRDELEKQIRPEWEQARKRSRMDDNTLVCLPADEPETQQETETKNHSENAKKAILYLTEHKELRKFLEEEQSPKTANLEGDEEKDMSNTATIMKPEADDNDNNNNGYIVEERLEKLEVQDGGKIYNIQFPSPHEPEEEEDEESRRQRGKGNVEKWLQFLLENNNNNNNNNNNTIDEPELNSQKITGENGTTTGRTDELIKKLNLIYPHRDIKLSKAQECAETIEMNDKNDVKCNTPFINNPPYRIETKKIKANESVSVDDENVIKKEKTEKGLLRSESARAFRRIPSSPSLILESMKKRVDCIRKKPLVLDDDHEEYGARSSFIKSSIKTLKRAVRI
ncbi:hypothetical protein PHJA_000232800 [Phtheirospermum japonicum]|uniref:Uncharacterized protein n=1 Tax=Phtheirospermum japonicum TaxID=374723 RepID=A0A830BA33_9LAMI|nr:hypothetical protein PHJA_000232800 [Phtheirospermum japonicum]